MPGTDIERGERAAARRGPWRCAANFLYAVAEVVCLLPVLLVWVILYRRSPDPP